ncbi:hypothetical protein J3F83DRAFT_711143 [Trichoderma novae-zelandiae]
MGSRYIRRLTGGPQLVLARRRRTGQVDGHCSEGSREAPRRAQDYAIRSNATLPGKAEQNRLKPTFAAPRDRPHLRRIEETGPDHEFALLSRTESLSYQAIHHFAEAMSLLNVSVYNLEHMERINTPCVRIAASNTGPKTYEADSLSAGNLNQRLHICIGTRVMLTENLTCWLSDPF